MALPWQGQHSEQTLRPQAILIPRQVWHADIELRSGPVESMLLLMCDKSSVTVGVVILAADVTRAVECERFTLHSPSKIGSQYDN